MARYVIRMDKLSPSLFWCSAEVCVCKLVANLSNQHKACLFCARCTSFSRRRATSHNSSWGARATAMICAQAIRTRRFLLRTRVKLRWRCSIWGCLHLGATMAQMHSECFGSQQVAILTWSLWNSIHPLRGQCVSQSIVRVGRCIVSLSRLARRGWIDCFSWQFLMDSCSDRFSLFLSFLYILIV